MPVNRLEIEGNLGQDPEVFADGKIVNLKIAHNHMKWAGEGIPKTKVVHWQKIKVVGYQAAFAAKYKKGDSVFAIGMLQTEEWKDKKTGEERSATVLHADSIRRTVKEERLDANPNSPKAEGFVNEDSLPF